MSNKKLGIALLFIVVILPVVSFAESSSDDRVTSVARVSSSSRSLSKTEEIKDVRVEVKNIKTQARSSIKDVKVEARENVKKEKEELRGEVKSIKATSILSVEDKKNKIKEDWEEKRENLEKIREERYEKIQEIRSNAQKIILEKRETLKIDLKKISDANKVKIVENTDEKLEKINNDRTDHLLDVLNRLENILAKINLRINVAQDNGIDVSSAKKASDNATKAIATARTAVEAQIAKVYKLTLTDENKLKADVGNTVKKLQEDLKQIRIVVQSSHDSVKKAAVALANAMGFDDKSKGSSSSASVSSSISSTSSTSSVASSASSATVSSSSSTASSVL